MTMPHEESDSRDPQGRPEDLDPTATSGEVIPPAESGVDIPNDPDPQALATEERQAEAEERAETRVEKPQATDEPVSDEGATTDQAEAGDQVAKAKEADEDPARETGDAVPAPPAPAKTAQPEVTDEQPQEVDPTAPDTPAETSVEQTSADQPSEEPADKPATPSAKEAAHAPEPAGESAAPESPAEPVDPVAEQPAKEAAQAADKSSEPEASPVEPVSPAEGEHKLAPGAEQKPSGEKPAPTKHEASRPGRKARPKPRPARPKPNPPKAKGPAAPVRQAAPTPPVDPRAAAEAASWGRVDDEGNVYLRPSGDEGERLVGQYAAGGSKDDALGMFVRRYLDLVAHVALLESRIENVNPQEIVPSLKSLEESLVEPAVIGDVKSLQERTERLKVRLKERHTEFAEERRRLKEEALERRRAIIDQVEQIAGQDPAKTHWRDSRAKLNDLFEQWKAAQRQGPKIDRKKEEELWQRFSRARTTFDRHRRQFFSRREAERAEVIARKERLIERAAQMNSSTDWGATSAAYRDLLEEWKKAGHASRKEDNELWSRFRAAQQVFYDARQAHHDSQASEQNANLKAKLELVKEAKELLPVRDIKAAKQKLHDIQDRWENIGFVPRKDIGRTEGKLREVEDAIRRAEEDQWRKSDPTKAQRASGLAAQLEESIAKLEKELEEAKASGDPRAEKKAAEALEARRAWMKALEN